MHVSVHPFFDATKREKNENHFKSNASIDFEVSHANQVPSPANQCSNSKTKKIFGDFFAVTF